MRNDIDKVLFDELTLANKVKEIGALIEQDFKGKELVVVGILKGANIFMSDLVRKINCPLIMDFMVVSSYGAATKSSGVVKILKDLDSDIKGKTVIIVEDIIDTGLTLSYLKEYLINREAAEVKLCTLLNKPAGRTKPIHIDYVGFDVPDEFIIGYGIDYAEKYRNLPVIATLKRDVYEK